MARKGGSVDKPEEMWQMVSFSRPSRMGQSSQYNQRHRTQAWYRNSFILHTTTLVIMDLTVPYGNSRRGPHLQKKEIPEIAQRANSIDVGYKAIKCPLRFGARGFIGSSVYDLQTKLSICGNKRTKSLKLLAEIGKNSSRWIWSRRNWEIAL